MSLNKSPPLLGMQTKAMMKTNYNIPRNRIAPAEGDMSKENIRMDKKGTFINYVTHFGVSGLAAVGKNETAYSSVVLG